VRLAQRIVLNSFVVATILMATVLVAVERRVTERVRAGEPSATWTADDLLSAVRRDIVIAGGAALLVGVLLAQLLARSVARPIEELRDVARGIAAGDLTQRPSRNIVGGEVGDLADAVRRVAEQLEARLQALQAEEALLVALTESLNEGVIAVDARQRVVRINDTARQLLRLREPVPFPADYLPRDRVLRDALAAVLAGEEAVPGEARIDDRTMSLTARPLQGGGAVIALYDLTPVRRLEAVRRDFVANVSHELRTPLTIINGFVETLQDDDEMPAALRSWEWPPPMCGACSVSWTISWISRVLNREDGSPIPRSSISTAWPSRSLRRCSRRPQRKGWHCGVICRLPRSTAIRRPRVRCSAICPRMRCGTPRPAKWCSSRNRPMTGSGSGCAIPAAGLAPSICHVFSNASTGPTRGVHGKRVAQDWGCRLCGIWPKRMGGASRPKVLRAKGRRSRRSFPPRSA
jgi:signal transduction histidine kinase